MIELKVGEFHVLNSGSVLVYENEPLEFVLDDGDGELKVQCVFEERDDVAQGEVLEGECENEGEESRLIFVNFNSRLGTGSKKPVEVGVYNERKLYLKYFVAAPKSSYKVFHYTWFLGKVVK
ncbi:DUF6864 domain-containing function [Tumebacillus permanentifrigoris]|uniref:Uncharacterized protein n=1 Tax=Tumebacillus permanentifrigoris TaxID=378543 RepID=A0A316DEA9_9BACL|nr:hypothetical protein [Tumebacillus permanentifrigoris]PWK15978.1 hypothetical protein C7459_102224 [Tumebacillus permanentifrigoris]